MSRSCGDLAVRLYIRSEKAFEAGVLTLRGVFDGVWLSVLSREQFALVDELYYDETPMYSTGSYNRSGLFAWEARAVERHFGGVRKLIVTSAGGGREVIALSKAGFEVQGFEPHLTLVGVGNAILEADGLEARIAASARDMWPSAAEKADGLVVGWSGYMLTVGRARRVAFLRGAARVLPPGAPVLVSFLAMGSHDIRMRTSARIATLLRRVRRADPVDRGDALVPVLVHYFTREQLVDEFADAGLELVDFGTDEYGWAVGRVRPGKRDDGNGREAVQVEGRRDRVAAGRR